MLRIFVAVFCILAIGISPAVANDQLNEKLLLAARENDFHEVERLVNVGADVNSRNRFGFTPLMLTGAPEVGTYLVKRGAIVDAELSNGLNALLMQTTYGNQKMVALLVESGADINRIGQFGMTPIMRACNFSKFDAVVYLAEKGANVNVEQADGNTALMMCVVSASTITKAKRSEQDKDADDSSYEMKMASAIEAIKALVKHGAKLDARRVIAIDSAKKITPLEAAIRLNRAEVIECLRGLSAS